MLTHDQAICLRKVEYSETSQILQLLTRQSGVVRVIAKGAHRTTKAGAGRFDGGIDILDLGDAVFIPHPNRDLGTLTEWKLRDGHLPLRRSLRSLMLAFHAAEITGALFEEFDPHPGLFETLERLAADLGGDRREEAVVACLLIVLRESGDLPLFDSCAACGKTLSDGAAAAFHPASGGLICPDCPVCDDAVRLDRGLLGVLRYVHRLADARPPQLGRLPRLQRAQTDPILRLLGVHVQHTLGRALRTLRYVVRSPQRRPAATPR